MSNGPIIPEAVSTPSNHALTSEAEKTHASSMLPRSASHTALVEAGSIKKRPERRDGIHRSLSENLLANTAGNVSRKDSVPRQSQDSVKSRRSLRRLGSTKDRPTQKESGSQHTVSKFIVGTGTATEDPIARPRSSTKERTPDRELKTRSVTSSLSKFARKSWASASRSPSPSPSTRRSRKEPDDAHDPAESFPKPTEISQGAQTYNAKATMNGTTRRNSILSKRPRRPLSSLLSKGHESPGTPSVPPIPKSYSTDKLPSLTHKSSTLSNPPALPKSRSFERLNGKGTESPRKKDELWSVFRNLDGEFQKFQSRPGTGKTGVVRSALLPFLRSCADHPSISSLRPEDLDRRTVILNKWWSGLLEMLNGRNGESVSGNERPVILEAVTALMVRPEWTLPSLASTARPYKTARASLKSRSTTSLVSTMTMSSDFLVESVYHNVRNTFTQNLLAQMAYVVDKMSMRSVAASVVTFCGKATAYAFFYCEGVAEILVRLWATSPDMVRRILTENGIQKNVKLDAVSERIGAIYPPCLQYLTFKSVPLMMKHLRSRPHLPIATAYIPWHGPWIGRWAGKDTDLFYVFTKFFTDLSCRFLPEDFSVEEMVAAPGWLLVQAQMLSVLDATMQRVNSKPPIDQNGALPMTFDDILGEADANATVLPLPANGAVRSMAENRLILLLRDCLSGSTSMTERTRSIFAQSFSTVLQATARKTSIFDHNACFALCDFLEEALVILTRHDQASESATTVIDWDFWLDVCKHMLQSRNSMTEVRLCAFLYAMWPIITSKDDKKRQICNDWLLTEETFYTQFNHWCPMVRAFFMRLLVWRVARADGSIPELNKSIVETLAERLRESWSHFLYLQEAAGKPLVAAPSSPAPGRRLLIMRNDVQPATAGMFLSFDGISSSSTSKGNAHEKHRLIDSSSQGRSTQGAKGAQGRGSFSESGKKRWALFKNIIPSSGPPKDRSRSSSSNHQQKAVDHLETNSHLPHTGSKVSAEKTTGQSPFFRSLSFKFSLEWFDRDANPGDAERRLHPPKLPPLAHLALDESREEAADNLDGIALMPEGIAAGPSKYAGRALAEWALLIVECDNFFERRKAEGVPSYQMVETPTLGVEPFRKL